MPGLPQLPPVEELYPYLDRFVRILALLVTALVLVRITNSSFKRLRGRFLAMMMEHAGLPGPELDKRAATLSEIFRKGLVATIWVVALMMALQEAGFDVRPLLAGAGIVGLAVGFGAQNLVRDVISGIFLLLDNQIRMDDVVLINGTPGRVEEINLRTTVLRADDGTVHVFRNGSINTLSNLTFGYSYFVLKIRVGHDEDTDRVTEALEAITEELRAEEPWSSAILEPLEVLGIEQLTDAGPVIQARLKTLPSQQWMVGREMNRRIKSRFAQMRIRLK